MHHLHRRLTRGALASVARPLSVWSKPLQFLRDVADIDNYATGAKLQQQADWLRLFLLARMRDAWPDEPSELDADTLPSVQAQKKFVTEHLDFQAPSMLALWNANRPPPLPPDDLETPISEEQRDAAAAEREEEMRAAQRAAFGFEVRVAPSGAGPNAGHGVFVSGSVPPGTVLLFYPGVSIEPADLLLLPGGIKHFQGNHYLMARFDRTIVDASQAALQLLPPESLELPLAVAHLVNHVPAGKKPNVVPAQVDWDSRVPAELIPLIPNVSFQHSTSTQRRMLIAAGGAVDEANELRTIADVFRTSLAESVRPAIPEHGPTLKGLALVAVRELRDEEVFLNYRLNPSNGYPDWYTPYDRAEDARRWS